MQSIDIEHIVGELKHRFDLPGALHAKTLGNGLIHQTYALLDESDRPKYVLQSINTAVFKDLTAIQNNVQRAAKHLSLHYPEYTFAYPLADEQGRIFQELAGEHWRIQHYVPESIALNVAESADHAYLASRHFADFVRRLSDCPIADFRPTIPDFHALQRYTRELDSAIQLATVERMKSAKKILDGLSHFSKIELWVEGIQKDSFFLSRVLHHDAKMSNLLVDENTLQPLCVIDLDTLMPGKYYSDLGDLIRSNACIATENEPDIQNIEVRKEFVFAVMEGYREGSDGMWGRDEQRNLPKAGKIMVYMQAIRFLSDYLCGNTYYKVEHETQNLLRAGNQLELLRQL